MVLGQEGYPVGAGTHVIAADNCGLPGTRELYAVAAFGDHVVVDTQRVGAAHDQGMFEVNESHAGDVEGVVVGGDFDSGLAVVVAVLVGGETDPVEAEVPEHDS